MLSPIKVWKQEPYPLFTSIAMETSAQCNRACVFCPNHDYVRPDKLMPMPLIEKGVTELAAMKYHGRWSPYMFNEPLKDPRWQSILRLVHRALPRATINVSTNGDYLTEDVLDTLLEIGTQQLIINIYSARDGHADAAKVAIGVRLAKERATLIQRWLDKRSKRIDQTQSLYAAMSSKAMPRVRVLHKYGVQPDGTNFDGGYELQNRSGDVQWLNATTDDSYSGMCGRPFRIFMMRYTGDMVLCCNDYHGKTAMGNLRDHTLVDLWNLPAMHAARAELQTGTRTGICSACNYSGGTYKHMIHPVQLSRATRTP